MLREAGRRSVFLVSLRIHRRYTYIFYLFICVNQTTEIRNSEIQHMYL
jgi:hypothetical protein